MSDLAAFDPPPSPPPPSYEISQFEFDRKTSHILEQSTHDPPQRRVDDDGFEIWDEAVFEAALNGMSTLSVGHSRQPSNSDRRASSSSAAPPPAFSPPPGSSRNSSYPPEKQRPRPLPSGPPAASSSSSASGSSSGSGSGSHVGSFSSSSVPSSPPQEVRPLRVQKKTRPQKERPAWYAEAGLGGGSLPPSPLEPCPQPRLQPHAGGSSLRTVQPALQRGLTVFNRADEDREATPPPEFSPVGPSLDGPPYETIVMTYEGNPASPGPAPVPSPAPPAFSPEAVAPPTSAPPAFSAEPVATRSPEPPAFAAPPPAVQPAAPVPAPVPTPDPATSQPSQGHPDPHPAAAHRQPTHAQTLPQRPVSSSIAPRPHAAHHQSILSSTSMHDKVQVKSRPMSFYPPGQPDAPRVPFNPQVAYAKPSTPSLPTRGEDPHSANPSSFYSNAVSAHYSFNVPARMRKQTLPPPQAEQPGISQPQYSGMGMVAPVASPRPNYGYSQATFSDTASIYSQSSTTNTTTTNNWGYGGQQGWPPAGGGYQTYR
ncbi:hypothetical protein GSI_00855 [Ganoderma sinense ZZ0214-1]|uniref:Uncharacterized protein n=1 Tax=Ganoderma sinense ZZ0214-1 TaxID=1077348 RepID=A0A2G8STX7_9APHY|nr:hypothetical protein GSI_00855 [Ganoderma sinense ZZ0214-1]